jgi:epoxyqueuosine reductase
LVKEHNEEQSEMIREIILSHLKPADKFIYGFASLTGLLDNRYEGFNWGISIARKLDNSIVDKIITGPTIEYYNHYNQINLELENLNKELTDDLNNNGFESISVQPTVKDKANDPEYLRTLTTSLSHKMVATRAGLGWIGKTDLFISPTFGPRLRLSSILIKTPVAPQNNPVEKSLCGKCRLCVDICPANAANGILWNTTTKREDFFDPWKCREQCARFGKEKLGADVRICGMCVAVCPIGRKPLK